ncbi:hypothetical protein DSO57_1036290 [Entomophthora muscae]|uniref:Uncharacterized protein n=2 Tax=Entomophthora muscae TaxID=34485 RepID=A0ACC2UK42_9FUNG|nr:hypothetical protein DSO57_1018469 [Entomophthora muscae]KAJ9087132.1 hypothetical protein DSO57_1036290 [Entomophthora muscae]
MKLITLISLVGSLQATKNYNAPKQVPITPKIQEKFMPGLQNAVYAMSLDKPAISVKSNNKDGTCVEVACQGCKDKATLKQTSMYVLSAFYAPDPRNNFVKSYKGCNCMLLYNQKDICQKANDKIIQVR